MITILDVLSLIQAPFIQRAFLIAIIIALLSSILSIFIVLKKISLIGDGLSHTAFGGLALGYYTTTLLFGGLATFGYYVGFIPQWVAAVTVILGSIGINKALRSTDFGRCSGCCLLATWASRRNCITERFPRLWG